MKFLNKFLWTFFIIVAVVSFVYLFVPDMSKYLELSAQDKAVSKRVEEEERKNNYYKQEIDDLVNNPAYIEKVAREKLGLSRPEEIIYKFGKDRETVGERVEAKKQSGK